MCSDVDGDKCAVGLKCVNRECVYDKGEYFIIIDWKWSGGLLQWFCLLHYFICSLQESCYFTKHIEDNSDLTVIPRCDLDGSYAAAQCKGDRSSGRCFCYSKTGQRIFGWDWWRNVVDAQEMACSCSRRRNELETVHQRINVTLHCQANGDYEPLQCDSGLCWCADKKTGMIAEDTIAVPQDLWTMLPCCEW